MLFTFVKGWLALISIYADETLMKGGNAQGGASILTRVIPSPPPDNATSNKLIDHIYLHNTMSPFENQWKRHRICFAELAFSQFFPFLLFVLTWISLAASWSTVKIVAFAPSRPFTAMRPFLKKFTKIRLSMITEICFRSCCMCYYYRKLVYSLEVTDRQ